MKKEKTFNYYYAEEKNIIYVPRNILELSRKNNIVIEGKSEIIDDGNYYSIHYKDLKKHSYHFQHIILHFHLFLF